MPNRIVFLAGSPGAGKTTLLKGLTAGRYKVVNIGSMMLNESKLKDRDKMRFLSDNEIKKLRRKVLERIASMNGNIIINAHASVEENGRYVPGISIEELKILKTLRAFMYIDAFTVDIVRRRKADKSRNRETERLELIDVQRLINVSVLSTAAAYLNIPIYILLNKQGAVKSSMKELRKDLAEAFG